MPGETKELAIKDEVVGDGEEARDGQMLTVSFKGRTMASNVEQSVEKFSFKLGEEVCSLLVLGILVCLLCYCIY